DSPHQPGASVPIGSPRLELRRPYPVSGEVSRVDAGEGFFGSGDEAFAVGFDDGFFRPLAEAGDGFAAGAAGADVSERWAFCREKERTTEYTKYTEGEWVGEGALVRSKSGCSVCSGYSVVPVSFC